MSASFAAAAVARNAVICTSASVTACSAATEAVRKVPSCTAVGFTVAKGALPVSAVDTVCAKVIRSARSKRDQSFRILAIRFLGSGALSSYVIPESKKTGGLESYRDKEAPW